MFEIEETNTHIKMVNKYVPGTLRSFNTPNCAFSYVLMHY